MKANQQKQGYVLKRISFFLFLILLLLPLTVNGNQMGPLTLQDAMRITVQQNPELKAAQYQQEVTEAGITQARSGYFPQIYFHEKFNRTTNPMWAFGTKLNQQQIQASDFDPDQLNHPDPINNFNTALSLSWDIYNGGRTKIGLAQAEQHQEIASLDLKRIRQKVIAQTGSRYVGLLLARENLNVIQQALETAMAHLKLVRSRFKGGFVVKSDLLRAQVRIAELEQQRLEAESHVNVTQAMLNASMGDIQNTPLNLITPFQKCIQTQGTGGRSDYPATVPPGSGRG